MENIGISWKLQISWIESEIGSDKQGGVDFGAERSPFAHDLAGPLASDDA